MNSSFFSEEQQHLQKSTTNLEDLIKIKMNARESQQFPTQNPYDLPPTHYPKNTERLTMDPYSIPGYIPPNTDDYIANYALENEKQNSYYLQKQKIKNGFFNIYQKLANKIIILSLFFFAFQLSSINTFIIQNFTFANIIDESGNLNTNGLILKSVLFGLIYYLYYIFFTDNE